MAQSVKPSDAGVTVGQVFQGKYRVDSILGQGGMGVVAECTHLALNERVAIKMLRQDVLADQDAVARFIREAQAAVKLKSEYVARVSDVGTADNGTPYMVMEYLEGHDLGDLLKQRGVLPVQWAVEIMLQTAEALCEAHSLGIVHRDIKPTNLFVTWRPDGSALIKVLDFGISKAPMGTDLQLTQTQSLLGTPAYMSPEQMRSARLVDHRTDIWSLGTVFYESLEGHRPFEADSFSEMCVKVAVDEPAVMKNTPAPLQQVILRCLAKAHEHRYPNMAEFARELVPFSSDPHAAQTLVDRMTRMLKRSGFDWEGGSTGVGRRPLNERGSGAVRATAPSQWGAGSDPAGRPWHGNTPARHVTPIPFTQDGSQPFARPYQDQSLALAATVDEPKKKRSKLPIILLALAVVTAAGVTIGIMASKDEPRSTEQQATQPDSTTPSTNPAANPAGAGSATGTNPATDTGGKPDPGTAAAGSATPPEEAGKPSQDGSASKAPDNKSDKTVKAGTGKESGKSTKSGGQATKSGGQTTKSGGQTTKSGGQTTKSGGTAATVKKDDGRAIKTSGGSTPTPTPPVEETKPDAPKPCDPFGAMHGCKK